MKTVDQILKKARLEKGLSIEEASQKLKIHPKFLEALESGNYEVFAHPLHIKGFLKKFTKLKSYINYNKSVSKSRGGKFCSLDCVYKFFTEPFYTKCSVIGCENKVKVSRRWKETKYNCYCEKHKRNRAIPP